MVTDSSNSQVSQAKTHLKRTRPLLGCLKDQRKFTCFRIRVETGDGDEADGISISSENSESSYSSCDNNKSCCDNDNTYGSFKLKDYSILHRMIENGQALPNIACRKLMYFQSSLTSLSKESGTTIFRRFLAMSEIVTFEANTIWA